MPGPTHILVPLIGAVGILIWRLRETTRPLTAKGIIIPPLAMSTGALMFAYPPTRVPWLWAVAALLSGALVLAWPLIRTSELQIDGDKIMLRRSKAFLWVILGLLVFRLVLRGVVETQVSLLQTGSLFYLLAFGMIVHWRVNMWFRYQKTRTHMSTSSASPDRSITN